MYCVFQHGMSPLQHAAYKGNKQMLDYLICHGADVNQNEHEHGYTALMFAALSGNANSASVNDVVFLLSRRMIYRTRFGIGKVFFKLSPYYE